VTLLRPHPLTLAISRAHGTCRPARVTPLHWVPCPDCARHYRANPGVRRMTICKVCDGSGRLAVM
jgi:hypothetical protein